jgi:hypothetical protein
VRIRRTTDRAPVWHTVVGAVVQRTCGGAVKYQPTAVPDDTSALSSRQ